MIEAVSSNKFGSVSKVKKDSNGNAVFGMHSKAVIQDLNKLPNQLLENSLNTLGVLGRANLSFKASLNSKEDVKQTPEIVQIKTQLKKEMKEVLQYGRQMLADADKEVKSELPSLEKDILPLIKLREEDNGIEAATEFDKYIGKDLTTLVQHDKETGNTIKEIFYRINNGNITVYGYNEYQPDGTPVFLTADYADGDIEELKYDWAMQEVGDSKVVGGNLVKFNDDGKPVMYTQYGPFLSGMDIIKLDPETGKETLKVRYKDVNSMDFPDVMYRKPKNPQRQGVMSQVDIVAGGKPNLVLNNEKDNYKSYCDRLGFISDFANGDKSYKYHGFEKGYEYIDGDDVRDDISGIAIPDFKA